MLKEALLAPDGQQVGEHHDKDQEPAIGLVARELQSMPDEATKSRSK